MQNNEILFKSLFKLQQMVPPYVFSETKTVINDFLGEAEKYQNARGLTQGILSNNEEFLEVLSRIIDAHQEHDRYKVASMVVDRWRSFSESVGTLARKKLQETAPQAVAEERYDAQLKIYKELYQRVWGKDLAGKKLLEDILENIKKDVPDEKRFAAVMEFVLSTKDDTMAGKVRLRDGAMKIAAEYLDMLPSAARFDAAKEWLGTSLQNNTKDKMPSTRKAVWKKAVQAIDDLSPAQQYDACIRLYEFGSRNKSTLDIVLNPLVDKLLGVIGKLPDGQKYEAAAHANRVAITPDQEKKSAAMMVQFLNRIPEDRWYQESQKVMPIVRGMPKVMKQVVEISFAGLKHEMEADRLEDHSEFSGLREIFKQATLCHLPHIADESFALIEKQLDNRPLSKRFGDAVWMLENTKPKSGQNERAFSRVVDSVAVIPEKDTHDYKEALALADAQTDPDRKAALESAIAKRQADFGLGLSQFLGMRPI